MKHCLAERRHNDWKKAIRKSRIVHNVYGWKEGWYDNLHQYSKNKIHCSCPICRCKTRDRDRRYGSKENWSMMDLRRLADMIDQAKEYLEEDE